MNRKNKGLRLSRKKLVVFVGIMTGVALTAWIFLMVGIFRKRETTKNGEKKNDNTPTQTVEIPKVETVRIYKETAAYYVLSDEKREAIRTTEYDEKGCPVKKTYYDLDGPREITYRYDEKRRLLYAEDRGLNEGTTGTITFSYDESGNLIEKKRVNFDEKSDAYRKGFDETDTFQYDAAGRVTDHYQYCRDSLCIAWHYQYDSAGNTIQETTDTFEDEMVTVRTTVFRTYRGNNTIEKIQQIREEFLGDSSGFQIVTETIYQYDDAGLEAGYASYDHGVLMQSMTWNGLSGEKISYDQNGKIEEQIVLTRDEGGHVLRTESATPDGRYHDIVEYDRQGRKTMEIEYIRDDMILWYRYEYDGRGNMISAIRLDADGNVVSRIEKTYTARGEELSRKQFTSDYAYYIEIECEQDENGNITRRTDYSSPGGTPGRGSISEYEYAEFIVPVELLNEEEKKSFAPETIKE